MVNYRVSLSFARLSDAELDDFTQNVITSMTGNTNYPTPVVSVTDLQTQLDSFRDALAAAAQGGAQATAAKNNAREQLLVFMRREAFYVQGIAANDLAILLSSGFNAGSTNRAQSALAKPAVAEIGNKVS